MAKQDSVIVVLGIDSTTKPRAARFGDADAAQKAADASGFRAVRVVNPELQKIASRLETVKGAVNSAASLPIVDHSVYDKLARLIVSEAELNSVEAAKQSQPNPQAPSAVTAGKASEAGGQGRAAQPPKADTAEPAQAPIAEKASEPGDGIRSAAAPDPAPPPADPWAAVYVGTVVLCRDDHDEAWYEAIVMAVEADGKTFTMRWRDYPGEPRFVASRNAVGLMKQAVR